MTNSPITSRTRRTTALIAATCCAAAALGGVRSQQLPQVIPTQRWLIAKQPRRPLPKGVSGFAWNETDHDIKLEVRESGSMVVAESRCVGRSGFTGYDKGNAGVDVFGSAKHADNGKKVYFEFDGAPTTATLRESVPNRR